jgi:hypothetical protein
MMGIYLQAFKLSRPVAGGAADFKKQNKFLSPPPILTLSLNYAFAQFLCPDVGDRSHHQSLKSYG